jgi:hypothetical protein
MLPNSPLYKEINHHPKVQKSQKQYLIKTIMAKSHTTNTTTARATTRRNSKKLKVILVFWYRAARWRL